MNNNSLIPKPINSAVEAANDHDTNSFLSHFVETALLTDEGQEYHGIKAIRKPDEK